MSDTKDNNSVFQKANSSAYGLQSCESENMSSESSLDYKPHKMVRTPSVFNLGSTKLDGQMTMASLSELKENGRVLHAKHLPSVEENAHLEFENSFHDKKNFEFRKEQTKKMKGVKRVQSDNLLSQNIHKLTQHFNLGKKIEQNLDHFAHFPECADSIGPIQNVALEIKKVKISEIEPKIKPAKIFIKKIQDSSNTATPTITTPEKLPQEASNELPSPKKFIQGVVFISMIMLGFGNYYFYNTPSIFSDGIIKEFDVTMVHIGYLYMIMSLPNFISVPLGTFLISKIGLGYITLLYATMNFIGQIVFYIGISKGSFALLIIGRGIWGIGFDNMMNCQNSIANRWFKGKFLSVAIGFN